MRVRLTTYIQHRCRRSVRREGGTHISRMFSVSIQPANKEDTSLADVTNLYPSVVGREQGRHDLRRSHPWGQIVPRCIALSGAPEPLSPAAITHFSFAAPARRFGRRRSRLRRRSGEAELVPLQLGRQPSHLLKILTGDELRHG